ASEATRHATALPAAMARAGWPVLAPPRGRNRGAGNALRNPGGCQFGAAGRPVRTQCGAVRAFGEPRDPEPRAASGPRVLTPALASGGGGAKSGGLSPG